MTKPKNAGFFSLHIEKIILLVALLISGALVMLYVVGSPNNLEMNGRSMTPDEAAKTTIDRVDALTRSLSNNESVITKPTLEDYDKDFSERSNTLALASDQFLPLGESGTAREITGDPSEGAPRYHRLRPPMPLNVVVRAGNGVIAKTVDFEYQRELREVLSTGDLKNWRYVTVGGKFPLDDWIDRLTATPKDENLKVMPKIWWQSMLYVTAVYLERQELDPYTGEWSESVIVSGLPRQGEVRPLDDPVNQGISRRLAQFFMKRIKEEQELVCRPEFPALEFPLQWYPPDSKQLTAEDHIAFSKLQKKIDSIKNRTKKMQIQLDRLNRAEMRNAARETGRQPTRIGRERPARESSSRSRSSRGRVTRSPEQKIQDDMQELNERLQELIIERDILLGRESDTIEIQDLRDDESMMYDEDGIMFDPRTDGEPELRYDKDGNLVGDEYELTEDGKRLISVWAHDVTVEPGKTYRYRLIVSMLNPLFRQNRIDAEQKERNYHQIAIAPSHEEREATPWTEPVVVDPQSHFFMVGKTQHGAAVELWGLHEGAWYSGKFTVKPGDVVEGQLEIQDPDRPGVVRDLTVYNGAIMVDIAEGNSPGSDVEMIYLKPGDDRISYRSIAGDRNNMDRIRLQNEAAILEEMRKNPDMMNDEFSEGYMGEMYADEMY